MLSPSDLRIALVHDWLTGMRGGEKCLEILVDLFPEADLYTLIHLEGKVSPAIERMNIRTSFIQHLPFSATKYRHYLPLFPRAVESFDLSGYDLIISTSHCVAKGAISGPGTLHICYCFTPMRYAWDQYQAYFGHLSGLKASAVRTAIGRLQKWDVLSSARVDHFIAISEYVKDRISKYYNRPSMVIYPPVDTDFFTISEKEGDYYLVVSALAPYKRLDIVIEAADELPYPVKIVGTGPEEKLLKKMAGPRIDFLGWLTAEELLSTYQGCRALLFPGEEDFGLTPLEAMSCGKPVIGYGQGGILETVIPLHREQGENEFPATGILFPKQKAEDLVNAALFLEKRAGTFRPEDIRRHALRFSREVFISRMRKTIEKMLPAMTDPK